LEATSDGVLGFTRNHRSRSTKVVQARVVRQQRFAGSLLRPATSSVSEQAVNKNKK
jgi:hypothetical protein